MKNRSKRTHENAVRKIHSQLVNPILTATMPEEGYRTNIATFIADESDSLFESSFQKLLNQKRFQNSFNCYADKVEDFFALPVFRQRVSSKRIIRMYKVLLKREAEKLTLFANIRGLARF